MSAVSPEDRRLLAHLGIPRNVENLTHELRVDEHATTRPEPEVHKRLQALQRKGQVVNLGAHDDPAHLAANLPADAIPLHDESAEIYSRRMLAPHHRWRFDGDLWILANEGLEALREPDKDEPAPMTVSQVQALIDQAWAKTHKGLTADAYNEQFGGADRPEGPSLAGGFLDHEFMEWATAVADDCEGRWGARPVLPKTYPPLEGGSQFSDAFEISVLDHWNQKTAMPALVDPWYMCLVIVALTDADTGTTAGDGTHVPTYTGYARKSVAGSDMNAGSGTGGSVTNANAITFAACTAGSSAIVGFGNTSASTNGILRSFGTCSVTISTTATPGTFAAAALTHTVA